MPRLSSGESFPQSERPPTIPQNDSFYGLTVKLRVLGIDALDAATGRRLLTFYGLFVIALVAFAAWRTRLDLGSSRDRLRLVIVALAIITLASFRSPFVGGFYGLMSSFLLGLMLAAYAQGIWRWFWIAAVLVIATTQQAVPAPIIAPPTAPALSAVALSVTTSVLAFAMNLWAVLRYARADATATGLTP
jgi:hypothetical protein